LKKVLFKVGLIWIVLFFHASIFASDQFDLSPSDPSKVALILYDIEAGKEVVSINGETPLYYASNLKLLTAASALHYLGGGFKFHTPFSFDSSDGTLFIRAMGDPEMVVEKMWVLANDLKNIGVSGVKKVVVDDFIYGEQSSYFVEGGKYGDNAYLAHISPIGLNYNAVEITVEAKEIEKPVKVTLTTPGAHFVVNNSAVGIKGGGNNLVVGSVPKDGKTEIVVRGSLGVSREKPVKVYKRVAYPSNHYIETLLYFLGETGSVPIERQKLSQSEMNRSSRINYTHKSSSLRDIVTTMNRYSSNYMAESIQYFMGSIIKGDSGKGVELMREYARKHLGEDVDIINGSGLGNDKNKLPGSFYMKILKKFYSDRYGMIDFFYSMPVIGEDGTLKKAAVDNGCSGCIRGKTGSLTGVTALSGIMKAKSGKTYLYVFAVNDFPAKSFKITWAFRDIVMNQVWEKY
jgi:serine-type D-Ala-D-Ala carboxypeptidase/endopeptidase (penicillin-binding protein 4)